MVVGGSSSFKEVMVTTSLDQMVVASRKYRGGGFRTAAVASYMDLVGVALGRQWWWFQSGDDGGMWCPYELWSHWS